MASTVRLAADMRNHTAIAAELASGKHVVGHWVGEWRGRFARRHADRLLDARPRGAPRRIATNRSTALSERPQGARHRSRRKLAKVGGVSATTIGRVC
ncbi:hypothetical protein [Methylobacterium terrae]|uniref:hypothetical protein n=1 Tax=Methylobacterium terrae TaxID=2202827 RepID=UPI0013A563B5|nr:hypothetical protein [Methylobacterium terrae]